MAVVVSTFLPNGEPFTHRDSVLLNNGMRIIPAFGAQVSLNEDRHDLAEGYFLPLIHLRVAFDATAARLVPHFVGLEEPEVTGTSLREVRVLECVQLAARHAIYLPAESGAPMSLAEAHVGSEWSTQIGVVTEDAHGRHARDAGPVTWVLEGVAFVYQLAQLCSRPPAQAVAEEFDVPARTASRWIARARAEGHLKGLALDGMQPGDVTARLHLYKLLAKRDGGSSDGKHQAAP